MLTTKTLKILIYYTITILVISGMSLSIIPVTLADDKLDVTPTSFTVNLVGGCTVTKDITVKWTGQHDVLCYITTNVTSNCPGGNGEGINVTYSVDSPFTLGQGISHVDIIIHAVANIMPGIYTITTLFSCEDEEEYHYYYSGSYNYHPIADASAGEEYVGYVDIDVMFNGSLSYDPDGSIVLYEWDFDDGTSGDGEIAGHSYSALGVYNVTLTVTDNEGASDVCETTANISENRLPSDPVIDGIRMGSKNIEYVYNATSLDPDNDTVRYVFDWTDGNTSVTGMLPSGIAGTKNHTWINSGTYIIQVYAEDVNNATSGVSIMAVWIDALPCKDIGYLIDDNSDGFYDTFYSNKTGSITTLGYKDGKYLIDDDDSGKWNYIFEPLDNLSAYLEEEDKGWVIILGIVSCAIIGTLLWILYHKKKQKKQ